MISKQELDRLLTMQAISINESDYDRFLSQIDSIVNFFDQIQNAQIEDNSLHEDNKKELVWNENNVFDNQEGIIENIDHPIVTNSLQISFKK